MWRFENLLTLLSFYWSSGAMDVLYCTASTFEWVRGIVQRELKPMKGLERRGLFGRGEK